MIKTKIVATLGPGCREAQTIKQMVDNGVDVFRLNFSHGSLDEHHRMFEQVCLVRGEHPHTIAVMGDLCGPKIRLGKIEPAIQQVDAGSEVTIFIGNEQPYSGYFPINYKNFARDVKIGDRVLIDDGQIAMQVIEKSEDKVRCRIIIAGNVQSNKGVNLPDSQVSAPSITEKDWQCVDWAIEHKLDFLALSFVRSGDDIRQLAGYLKEKGSDIKIVAKIETPCSLKNLDDIIEASNVILIARGDLGVEMDLAEVPLIQKRITHMCRRRGKAVIVATQMLQSMIENPFPTRAEVSDTANAIMDFTDAVMLSGETSIGKYPVEAAKTIRRIAQYTESYLEQGDAVYPKIATTDELLLTAAMAHSVAHITEDIAAKLVAVWSETGSGARLLSKARLDAPILAFTSNQRICRQMCLHYGVIPRCRAIPANTEEFIQIVDKMALERGWLQPGDRIILVAGKPIGKAGTTNTITVHTVTSD
ncbi:MAG: pyruvate kinase [Phycisphaerae bacterium]